MADDILDLDTLDLDQPKAMKQPSAVDTFLEPYKRLGTGLYNVLASPYRATQEGIAAYQGIQKGDYKPLQHIGTESLRGLEETAQAAPTIVGGTLGAVSGVPGGAYLGAAAGQGLTDLSRYLIGEERISPQEAVIRAQTAGLGTVSPGQVARGGLKLAGAGTRAVVKGMLPGSAVPLQANAIDTARRAVENVPRPPLASEATQATQTEAQAAQAAARAAQEAELQRAGQQVAGYQASNLRASKKLGDLLPYEEHPYAPVEALTKLGGTASPIPIESTVAAVENVAGDLTPLIKRWAIDGTVTEQQAATQLSKFLEGRGGATTALELHQLNQKVGPLIQAAKKATGEPMDPSGRVWSEISRGIHNDLQRGMQSGDPFSKAVLEANAAYKRKVAVGTFKEILTQATRTKPGGPQFSPTAAEGVLNLMNFPRTRGGQQFAQRLKQSLSPEEYQNVTEILQQIVETPRKASEVARPVEAPPTAPKPPAQAQVQSLQDFLEQNIRGVQGTSTPTGAAEQLNSANVLNRLPGGGRLTENPTTKFLEENLSPADASRLRETFTELNKTPNIRTGAAAFIERLPIYALLGLVTGLGGYGAGGGAAAMGTGAIGVLAAEALTNRLKSLAAESPGYGRAIVRGSQYRPQPGAGTQALDVLGPTLAQFLKGERKR